MCDNRPEQPITVSSLQPSYTLTSLHPHSKYRIGVAARTTIAGTESPIPDLHGRASISGERVSREIQTDPGVPTAPPAYVRVDRADESTAELSWHAPPCVHTNGDISEYEYEVFPSDPYASGVPRITETISGTRVPLQSLIPSTRYNARVRAFTSRGPGPWSPEVPFETRVTRTATPPSSRIVTTSPTEAHLVWQTNPNNVGWYDKFKCEFAPSGTQQYQERVFPYYSPCDEAMIRRQQLPANTPQSTTHCGRIDNLQPDTTYDYQVRQTYERRRLSTVLLRYLRRCVVVHGRLRTDHRWSATNALCEHRLLRRLPHRFSASTSDH